MPSIGPRCHELRVRGDRQNWRLVYRIDDDAIVLLDVLAKKTTKTPKTVLDICKSRLKRYDELS